MNDGRRSGLVAGLASISLVAGIGCASELVETHSRAQPGSAATSTRVTTHAREHRTALRFRDALPPPGTAWIEHTRSTLDFELVTRADGLLRRSTSTKTRLEQKRVTVLETHRNAVTRKRLTYLESTNRERVDGRERVRPNPLVGKTYVVAIDSRGERSVTDANGDLVGALERDLVLDDNASLGVPDPFSLMLAGRALHPGARLVAGEGALAGFARVGVEAREVELSFLGIETHQRRRLGRFELALEMTGREGPAQIVLDLEGRALVDPATSWPVEARLSGPVRVRGAGGHIDGTGHARLEVTLDVIRR